MYGNCYNFFLVDPSIGNAVFSNFESFQCLSIRAVINVWGELWTQPGIEHRAQWLPKRGPGDPQNEMYLGWTVIIYHIRWIWIELWTHRQLQWVPGCLFKRGTPIRWSLNYLPFLKKILFSPVIKFPCEGGWVWDRPCSRSADQHLYSAGDLQIYRAHHRGGETSIYAADEQRNIFPKNT